MFPRPKISSVGPKFTDMGDLLADVVPAVENEIKMFNSLSSYKKNIASDLDNTELAEEYINQINKLLQPLAKIVYDGIIQRVSRGGKSRNHNKRNKNKRTKRNRK